MTEKFEFGSRPWRQALIDNVLRRAAAAPAQLRGVEFSSCEVFTDVPEHLAEDESRRVAWHLRIHNGALECGLTELENAQWKVTADHAALVRLAKIELGPDPQAGQAIAREAMGALMAAGRLTLEGSRDGRPEFMAGLHDDMAAITL